MAIDGEALLIHDATEAEPRSHDATARKLLRFLHAPWATRIRP
jgi:hypothetical protein